MASKETRQRREEMRLIFNEVYQLAYIGATEIRKRSLDEYKKRFEELTERKKKGGEDGA